MLFCTRGTYGALFLYYYPYYKHAASLGLENSLKQVTYNAVHKQEDFTCMSGDSMHDNSW